MENAEKVCRKCGTLNDSRSLMCVRCGGSLEITEEQQNQIFKGRMLSNFWFTTLFVLLFSAYLYGIIFYAGPWFQEILEKFGESFIFDFYNNPNITYIALEAIYTVSLFLVNTIVTIILLESIVNSKLLRKNRINITSGFIFLYLFISASVMTYYKHELNYVIITEHVISTIVIFPYIRKKLLKRSV